MALTKRVVAASLIVGGTLGAMAIFNRMTESMAGELDTVLTGEERRYPWKYGDLFYEVKGEPTAKPLVLIHGFSPGASSYEWRKNIDALSEQFHVYALDLLGFGLSDHPALDYDAETYVDQISDFMREVVGKPAIVVAHGLSGAYTIAGAYRYPHLFERLVLIAPPLAMLQETYPGPLNALVKFALRTPIVGQFVYNLLTSRKAIRGYYDRQGYHNPGLISDELVEYIFTSAHQPASRYAQASFLSGYLNLDAQEPFLRLQMPVIAVWGREGTPSPTEMSQAFKKANGRIDVRIIEKSHVHLQDEQAGQLNNLIRELAGATIY